MNNGWIDIKEDVPLNNETVLIRVDYGDDNITPHVVEYASYRQEDGSVVGYWQGVEGVVHFRTEDGITDSNNIISDCEEGTITHWQYLPSLDVPPPPKPRDTTREEYAHIILTRLRRLHAQVILPEGVSIRQDYTSYELIPSDVNHITVTVTQVGGRTITWNFPFNNLGVGYTIDYNDFLHNL